jgi:transcription antitermination factor NusG
MGRSLVAENEIAAFFADGGAVTRGAPVKARYGGWARPKPVIASPARLDEPAVDFIVDAGGGVTLGQHWYIVAVEPGRDYRIAEELSRGGVETWLPECRVRKRDARKGTMLLKIEPVFPGYLLVRLDRDRVSAGLIAAIEGVDGVDCLLRRVGDLRPCPLPGGEVASLKEQIDVSQGVVIIEAGACRWKKRDERNRKEICAPGAEVRVLAGMFQGFNGLYLETTAIGRIKILLDIFGRSTPIDIEEALAQPV